jgi:hypothetical protein
LFLAFTSPHEIIAQRSGSLEGDPRLMRVVEVADHGAARAAGVWPGYRIPIEYIICNADGPTIVTTASPPPSKFGQPLSISPSTTTGTTVYLYAEPPPGLDFVCLDLEYPVGQARLLAVPLIDSVYSLTEPVLASLALLYHEAFHRYQDDHFAHTHGDTTYRPLLEPKIPLQIIQSQEFQRLARIERVLLADALAVVGKPNSLRSILRNYLSARWKRMQLLAPEHRGAEPHNERKEGSANLVGYEAAHLVAQGTTEGVASLVIADLLATPGFGGEDYMSNGYREWHIYATGAAIGLVLGRLNIEWRQAMQDGATFEELLRSAVSFTDEDADILYRRLQAES